MSEQKSSGSSTSSDSSDSDNLTDDISGLAPPDIQAADEKRKISFQEMNITTPSSLVGVDDNKSNNSNNDNSGNSGKNSNNVSFESSFLQPAILAPASSAAATSSSSNASSSAAASIRRYDSLPPSALKDGPLSFNPYSSEVLGGGKKKRRHHHKGHHSRKHKRGSSKGSEEDSAGPRDSRPSTCDSPPIPKSSHRATPSLVQSFNSFESSSDSDNDSDIGKSPLSQNEDGGASAKLGQLFEILEISKEDQKSIEDLNEKVFPDPGEWVIDPKNSENGSPSCASFNQLILCLTSPDTANIEFQKQFLVSFPSFASPPQVLAAIFKRYFADINQPGSNIENAQKLKQVRDRIIRILSTWMKLTSYQFTNNMINAIRNFSETFEEGSLQKKIIQASIDHLDGKKILHETKITKKGTVPQPILPSTPPETWKILDISPVEIARQVTLHHSDIFRSIGVMELLSAIWGQKKGGNSPNVEALTKHFDIFSRYVQFSTIEGKDPKKRALIFQWWVEVAITFREQNNFHGVFAVICGLTHRSVQRMADTMKQVNKMPKKTKKQYDELCELCDFSGDFRNYRPVINSSLEPCIPFIGCFQKDLIYVQEGFPNKINDLTNFKKCTACISIIKFVERFQNERYNFDIISRIQELITTIPEMPDTTGMMQMSIAIEKKK